MLASWKGWQLQHVRWIGTSSYLVGGIVALVLGVGSWSALIGAVTALAVVCPLEIWTRYRREPPIRDDFSRYP